MYAPPPLQRVVWLNGHFVDASEARVSLFDRGYQLGEGVFATMRAYAYRCFRKDRHLAQLAADAARLGLAVTDLADVVDEAARRSGERDARVRVTVTETATSIVAEKIAAPSEAEYAAGIAAAIVDERRYPSTLAKSTSYVGAVLARRQAAPREALQLAADGTIACAAMANVFLARGRELVTPWLASGCRPGITRREVLELAPSLGLVATERAVQVAELFDADEVFLTSTRVECLAVATIDDRAIGRGPFAAALRAALRERAT